MIDSDKLAEDSTDRAGISSPLNSLMESSKDAGLDGNRHTSSDTDVPVFILGKRYYVPEGCTIQKAYEFAGYKLIRGCGCRAGFCGACGTVYRIAGDYRLKMGLACQTVVAPEMQLTTIPFFPAQKALYDLNRIREPAKTAIELYPELTRCFGCATCNRACPQNLDVLSYIAAIIQGDLERAAELSFECVMCGLCAARCPAEIAPYNAALYTRRASAKLIRSKSGPLATRVAEIRSGKFNAEIAELIRLDVETLKKRHAALDMEIP